MGIDISQLSPAAQKQALRKLAELERRKGERKVETFSPAGLDSSLLRKGARDHPSQSATLTVPPMGGTKSTGEAEGQAGSHGECKRGGKGLTGECVGGRQSAAPTNGGGRSRSGKAEQRTATPLRETMKLVLYGDPRTKKNSQQIITGNNGKRRVIPSKQYGDYEKSCLDQMQAWRLKNRVSAPVLDRVNVKAVYYMKTRRRVDLVNLLEATDDILVRGGILLDDNADIIVSHDGSRVRHDKGDPRVEITISKGN